MENYVDKFKVSVVIPVYNVKQFLPKLFININNQIYKNFEVLFIDDGSTDGSSCLLDAACTQNNNFRVIHQKNHGTGYSRNIGIAQSEGKYIFFMDPDDNMSNRLLLDNVRCIEKHKADIVIFNFSVVNDQGKELDKKQYTSEQNHLNGYTVEKHFEELYDQLVFHALWHKLIRKKFIVDNQVSSPLWSNSQDRGFLMKLALYNPKLIFNNTNISYYRYVSMRKGASTAKFKKNLTDIGFQLASCVEDVISKFNIVRTRNLMYEVYIRDVYMYTGLTNVLRAGGPSNILSKTRYVNKIYSNKLFTENAFSGENQAHNFRIKKRLITYIVQLRLTIIMLLLFILFKE